MVALWDCGYEAEELEPLPDEVLLSRADFDMYSDLYKLMVGFRPRSNITYAEYETFLRDYDEWWDGLRAGLEWEEARDLEEEEKLYEEAIRWEDFTWPVEDDMPPPRFPTLAGWFIALWEEGRAIA